MRQERNTFPDIPREIKLTDTCFNDIIKGQTVVLDMGCGHGDFMIEYTRENPSKLYIGIEIWRKRVHYTSTRLQKRGIENYYVISAPGDVALKSLFPNDSVDEMNVNFPDPWMKERQWKNRILRPSFLIESLRVLKPGGVLNFVTDIEEYAVAGSELFQRFPGFVNHYDEVIKKNLYPKFPTLFFDKMSPLRDINYVSYEKVTNKG